MIFLKILKIYIVNQNGINELMAFFKLDFFYYSTVIITMTIIRDDYLTI